MNKQADFTDLSEREIFDVVANNASDEEIIRKAANCLVEQWWERIQTSCRFKGLNDDDTSEVIIRVIVSLRRDLPKFQHMSDEQTKAWMKQKINWAILDHQRYLKRSQGPFQQISIEEGISLNNDGGVDLIEVIEQEMIDPDDEAQRYEIIQVAEQILVNEKYLALVKCKLLGWPYPEGWSRNYINATWHRVKNLLLVEFANRKSFDK